MYLHERNLIFGYSWIWKVDDEGVILVGGNTGSADIGIKKSWDILNWNHKKGFTYNIITEDEAFLEML